MDVRKRVANCRLLTKMKKDPCFSQKLGLQDLSVINMEEKKDYELQSNGTGNFRQIRDSRWQTHKN